MRDTTFTPSRILIYLVVSLIAAAYLVPLLVVVLNSLRTAQEIAQTSMIGWPKQWAWNNYVIAWGDFCVAQTCAGIRPYMLNSALVTVPATIVSTLLGAVAGYAVSLWRFRGRSLDLRRGYPWHLSPPADAPASLDHRAARHSASPTRSRAW